jgi:hypothetical protein
MMKPSMSSSVLVGVLILLWAALGCASPKASLTDKSIEQRQESCTSNQQKTARDRGAMTSCQSQRSWFEQAGDALSGAASAFRAPSP